jgi:hypothetical protein
LRSVSLMPAVRSRVAQVERTLHQAVRFLEEMREDMERAMIDGLDTPPRIRSVHERTGHATPEYRTLNIPIPEGAGGASPTLLSGAIASYARKNPPQCLLLGMDIVMATAEGPRPVLIAEARDRAGTRLFWMQPYWLEGNAISWGEPDEGGWRDPREEELILDAAFSRGR